MVERPAGLPRDPKCRDHRSRHRREEEVARIVEKWLHWLKKAQDVLGSRNDRSAAAARINGLCDAITKRHGKIRRTLHAVLEDHALPALDLAPLPAPFWR